MAIKIVEAGYSGLDSAISAATNPNTDYYPNILTCENEDEIHITFTAFNDDVNRNTAYYELVLRTDKANNLYASLSAKITDNTVARLMSATGRFGLPNGMFVEYNTQSSDAAGDTSLTLLTNVLVGSYPYYEQYDIGMMTMSSMSLSHSTINTSTNTQTNVTTTQNKFLESISIIPYYTRPTGLFNLKLLCNNKKYLSNGDTVYSDDVITLSGDSATHGENNNIIGYRLKIEHENGTESQRRYVLTNETSCDISSTDFDYARTVFFDRYGYGESTNVKVSVCALGALRPQDDEISDIICAETEAVEYDSIYLTLVDSQRPKQKASVYVYTATGWKPGRVMIRAAAGWNSGMPKIITTELVTADDFVLQDCNGTYLNYREDT